MENMTTYQGRSFDPLQPDMEQVDLADIAHALSLLCRGGGHTRIFYSVGQHAIACCMEAKQRGYEKRIQFACLLHDAAEAYLGDVIRPLKEQMPAYRQAEDRLLKAIWQRYLGTPLTEAEERLVFAIDDAMLEYEFAHLMAKPLDKTVTPLISSPSYISEQPEQVEQQFLELANRYLDEA